MMRYQSIRLEIYLRQIKFFGYLVSKAKEKEDKQLLNKTDY